MPVLYENGNLLPILADVFLELLELGVVHGRKQIGGRMNGEAAAKCCCVDWCIHSGFSLLLFVGHVNSKHGVTLAAKHFRMVKSDHHERS